MPSKLAHLIATEEGFYEKGTLPQRNHNPGDLRHSPHSQHPGDPNDIGVIASDADGWEDLERQLRLYADRGLTLSQAIYEWAPPTDNNDTPKYLFDVVQGFGGAVTSETPLTKVLEILA